MIIFEDGVLVSPAKVNEDGTITPATYSGKTPLSAYTLNKMQELTEIFTGKNISAETVEGACKITKISGVLQQSGTPTPDTPIEIEVVGDNINLFDLKSVEIGSNCTYNINDNSIVIKATGTNAYVKSKTYNLSAGSYNLSGSATSDDYKGVAIYVNGSYFDSVASSNLEKTFTLTEDGEVVFRFYASSSSSSTSATAIYSNIKLEQGTVATGYTSYGVGGIDLKTIGKNLIGVKDSSSSTNLGITAEYDSSTGLYTLNGTSTNAGYIKLYDVLEVCNYTNLNTKNRTLMSKGDYILSYKYISGTKTDGTANIMIRDCNDSIELPQYEINKFGTEERQLQFTVDEEYLTQKYIWFASGTTFTDFKFSTQLEIGTTLSEHEPYKEQSTIIELPKNEFLAKISDVQDYIDSKGVLHKYIKKSVGSELGWRLGGTQNFEDSLIFYSTTKDAKFDNNLNNNIKSTHFKSGNSYSNNNEIIGIMSTGELGIRVKTTTASSLEEFTTWLDTNNVEIYYELATPYTVDLDFNNIIPQYAEQTNVISNAEIEVEFAKNTAIASVNETFYKIQDEAVAISSDSPNNKNVWIQKNDNLIGVLKANDIDTATGLEVEYDGFVITQEYIPVKSNTNYYAEYISNSSGGKQIVIYEYDINHNYLDYHHINDKTYYFSTSSNSAYIKIRFMETNINITAVLRKGDQKIWTKNNGIYEEFINVDDVISNQFKRNDRYDSTDFNSFTKNGFYMINVQNCTNAPNPYATGMLLVFGGYYISQLFIADLNGTTVGYIRTSSDKGVTWNDWSQITS